MIESLYTISIALPITCAAIGSGIGQGKIGYTALKAVNIQPSAANDIEKISLIGISLTETAAILGLVFSIILMLDSSVPTDYFYASLGRLGIVFAIGLTSLIAGIVASLPSEAACLAVARQPFFSGKILQVMLLTQTIIMTPNIFGFLIALFIQAKVATAINITDGLQLLAAGLCIGFGSIGASIGLSNFAGAACQSLGVNRKSYNELLTFVFICEGIIETSVIFSLLISLVILNSSSTADPLRGIAFVAAAFCMSFSTIGTGISAGKIASSACESIGISPANYASISRIGILALVMIDTFAIYGLIISIILLIYAA